MGQAVVAPPGFDQEIVAPAPGSQREATPKKPPRPWRKEGAQSPATAEPESHTIAKGVATVMLNTIEGLDTPQKTKEEAIKSDTPQKSKEEVLKSVKEATAVYGPEVANLVKESLKISKKLRDVEKLEQESLSGAKMDKLQLQKIEQKGELESKLADIEKSIASMTN